MDNKIKNESLLYVHKLNMKIYALKMITFGYATFARAKHIQDLSKFSKLVNKLDDIRSLTQENKSQLFEFNINTLIDWIRVSICFENYMKAILLQKGYLIHQINKEIPELENLAKSQKKRPIPVSEFQEINLILDKKVSRERLKEGLKLQTIQFNLLLKTKYQNKIQLPAGIHKIITEINKKRNNLHFYHEAENSYSKKKIEDLVLLKKYVEEDIMGLAKSIEIEINQETLSISK